MQRIVEIDHLNITRNNTFLLKNIHLCFYEGTSVFLCGTNAAGKTLLLKAIAGKIKYTGHIYKKGKVEVVFDKNCFLTSRVDDELKYLTLDEEEKQIVATFLSLSFLDKDPNQLDLETKKMLILCNAFLKKPAILFVDNLFSFLGKANLEKVYSYARANQVTLVSVSTNIEEAYAYPYMIVMHKGEVALEGKTLQVLEQEKILKRLGIGLPFYHDLSIQLKLYGLIDQIYLSKEELVQALWK